MAKEKCWCSFITKANDGATSQQMQVQILLQQTNASVGAAS